MRDAMLGHGLVGSGLLAVLSLWGNDAFGALPSPRVQRAWASASPLGAPVDAPHRADGAMTVRSESGMVVSVRLDGASSALAERAGDEVAFRGGVVVGGRAFDFILRSISGGVEDFVYFDVRPAVARVLYRIDVSRVAGLRLIDDVLELLDSGGAPRLRVRRPYLIDAEGRRHAASLEVRGCAVDTSALPPWGRPVVAPGAASCELQVSWSPDVKYPAALDPAWVAGGTMVYPRNGHAAALVGNGKVLVSGGWLAIGATNYTNVVEIFDPSTKTWAAAKAMNHARGQFTTVTLKSGANAGKVLAIAGDDAMAPTAEIYDPTLATWTDTSPMKSHRDEAAATLLAGGKVLAGGGCTSYNSVTCLSLGSSAEVFDPATGVWSATANSMSEPRTYFTLSPLPDGRAVAVGGCKQMTSGFTCFNSSSTADIYDPTTNSWTKAANLPTSIQLHVAVTLSNGKVLAAGGIGSGAIHRKSMLFDPVAGTWSLTGDLSADHDVAAGVPLSNGRALIAGSWGTQFDNNQVTPAVDVFDSSTSTWSPGATMMAPHGDHTATTLADGRVLVAGGFGQGPAFTLTESDVGEIYDDTLVPSCPGTPTLDSKCSDCAKSACCPAITTCHSNAACSQAMGCFAYCGAQQSSLSCLLSCSCLSGSEYNAFKEVAYCISQVQCASSCSQVNGTGGAPACGSGGSGGTGGAGSGGAGGSTGGAGGSAGGSGGTSGGAAGTGGTTGTGATGGTGSTGGASGGAGGVTGSGGAPGGASGNGGTGTGGVGASGGSSGTTAGSSGESGGCSCATPGARANGSWLALALAVAFGRRRRPQGRRRNAR
ncbi:MAG: hypothetical protein HYZ29_21555 [Myxococcales bacterium]|nr:hypothetical protein [Myxococcales bacterium]